MTTLRKVIAERSNDYSSLEKTFREATGQDLTCDPFAEPALSGPGRESVTVVIPAWNAEGTLMRCLAALERSSFNLKYPQLLQVVVVDDGSSDSTWSMLKESALSLHLTGIRQRHLGQAQALNVGIGVAEGSIVVCCDADMITGYYALELLVQRHEEVPDCLLAGFRSDVDIDDPRISLDRIRLWGGPRNPCYVDDERIRFPIPGWPKNMCLSSGHYKELGFGRSLWMPDSNADPWVLPDLVFGVLFSARRNVLLQSGGFDERFEGWGCTDTFLAAKAIGLGQYIVPVYAASGLHVKHPPRTPNKDAEYLINRRLLWDLIGTSGQEDFPDWIPQAGRRIVDGFSRSPAAVSLNIAGPADGPSISYRPLDHARCLLVIGQYRRLLEDVGSQTEILRDAQMAICVAEALLELGQGDESIAVLQEAGAYSDLQPELNLALAVGLAARGDFRPAHEILVHLEKAVPEMPDLAYWSRRPLATHVQQGMNYLNQGFGQVAKRCFEAALILDPTQRSVQKLRDQAANC